MARGQATPIKLNMERVDYWTKVGAQFSDRAKQLVNSVKKDKSPQAQERMTSQKMKQAAASEEKQRLSIEAEKKAAAEAESESATEE